MLTRDVLSYYGGPTAAARAVNITRAAVYQWGDLVPALTALKFERASKGKLKFNNAAYLEYKSASSKKRRRAS
jgi:hypothetical protein